MLKPQKKKYRVFARDFDKKPSIEEYDELDDVIKYLEEKQWITISIERKCQNSQKK